MTRSSAIEAALDNALAEALLQNQEFARWLLRQTRFVAEEAKCVEVRANNPWSRVTLRLPVGEDGSVEEVIRDAETDVLAIFETGDGQRIALHIENKLEGGAFTPHQPETYRERLKQWRERPKLGMYHDATSVLVAPQAFYVRNADGARVFEAFVSHEAIAKHLPAFAGGSAA
jgi:hypothetical protein